MKLHLPYYLIIFLFLSCNNSSKQNLLLGKWRGATILDKGWPRYWIFTFNKNDSAAFDTYQQENLLDGQYKVVYKFDTASNLISTTILNMPGIKSGIFEETWRVVKLSEDSLILQRGLGDSINIFSFSRFK